MSASIENIEQLDEAVRALRAEGVLDADIVEMVLETLREEDE